MASNEAQTTTEVVVIDDESKEEKENEMTNNEEENDSLNRSTNNQTASCPNSPKTPLNETKLKDKSKSEKIDKNLKLQMKLENAKKRQEEKEKKDKEKQRKEEERKQKELERLKQKEEELKKKEEERLKREAEKRQREEERLKKEEERKQKELERLKKKEEEEKKKEEERLKKEEERKQKEEERLKREEEKQREEEEKRKKADMAKNQFKSYFIKKDHPNLGEMIKEENKNYRFMPFQPKENMTIAPISFRKDFLLMNHDERAEFYKSIDESVFQDTDINLRNFLNEAQKRDKFQKIKHENNSEPPSQEIKVVNFESNRTKFKVKYLHFDPKVFRRPPYYGTWRKKSLVVKARKPFSKDQNLDYEIDSDDEWEDEPEGESISGSECDDDEEMVEDDEDDGFFVPHGHLSDDELDEEDRSLDPETKKARENAKTEQWEKERKKMCKVLTAKHFIIENFWNSNSKMNIKMNEIEYLKTLKAIGLITELPIVIINENIHEKQVLKDESTPKAKSKSSSNNNNNNANKEAAAEQASPSMSIKSKSKHKPNSANPNSLSPTTNTPSIIKFISKMGNKNVICKVESSNEAVVEAKSPNVINVKNANAHPSPKQQTPNNNVSVAEKRVCSGNSESAVKRLKLENDQDSKDSSPKIMTLTVTPQLKNNKKTLKFVTSTNESKEKKVEKLNSSHLKSQEPERMEIDNCSNVQVSTEKTSTNEKGDSIAPSNKENQIDCIIIEDVN